MVAWIGGLEPLSRLIGPVDRDGTLAPLFVAVRGPRVSTTWFTGNPDDVPTAESVPPEAFQGHGDWALALSAHIGESQGWPWRWTLRTLRQGLEGLLQTRRIPVSDKSVRREAAWTAALALVGRGEHDRRPIAIDKLDGELTRYDGVQATVLRRRLVRLDELRTEIAELIEVGRDEIEAPWPGYDLPVEGGWVWARYSPNALERRTQVVYAAALEAFTSIASTWFVPLKPSMPLYLSLPVRLVGELSLPSLESGGLGPGLTTRFEVLQPTARNQVDMKLGRSIDIFSSRSSESDRQPTGHPRPEIPPGRGVHGHGSVQILDIFGPAPVTSIVYRWLSDDLSASNWMQALLGSEEHLSVPGAVIADMTVIKLDE
jgi:hypothetical protein